MEVSEIHREEKFLTKDDKIDLVRSMHEDKSELILMMKKDRVELIRAIYIASVVNFLAIVGTLLGILSFMLKNFQR